MKALLLAAGFGKRLQPYTLKVAKPAMAFLDRPLLAYPLALLEEIGIETVHYNTHHLPETVNLAIGAVRPFLNCNLIQSNEQPIILDSGGAVDKLRNEFVSEDFFLFANADAVLNFAVYGGLKRLIDTHKKNKALATILTCQHPEVGKTFGGIWIDKNKNVLSIGKSVPPQAHDGLHFTGYMVLSKRVLDYIPKAKPSHIFNDVLSVAIKKNEVVISHKEEMEWFETGTVEDFTKAEKRCSELLSEKGKNTLQYCYHKYDGIHYSTNS